MALGRPINLLTLPAPLRFAEEHVVESLGPIHEGIAA